MLVAATSSLLSPPPDLLLQPKTLSCSNCCLLSFRSRPTTQTRLKHSALVEGNDPRWECTYLSHARPNLSADFSYVVKSGFDGGLEQPVANWVKLCVSLEGGGKKVHPVALTPESRVQSRETRSAPAATPTPGSHHTLPKGPGAIALGTYTTIAPPGLEISKLATTRFPTSKLATARILCF